MHACTPQLVDIENEYLGKLKIRAPHNKFKIKLFKNISAGAQLAHSPQSPCGSSAASRARATRHRHRGAEEAIGPLDERRSYLCLIYV